MHQRANPEKFEFARTLRENPTPQEAKLWNALKNNQLNGYKFRKQHPLSRFERLRFKKLTRQNRNIIWKIFFSFKILHFSHQFSIENFGFQIFIF
jgi:Protein of unknown function (DUF559)